MNQHTAICMAASLIWAANAFAARAECPTSEGARVSVEVTAGPVATAFDTSLPELERLAQTAGREAHMPLRAVYSSSVLFTSEIDSRVEQGEGGAYCAVAKSVRVRIAIGRRTIHAARELRDKTCLRTAATDHAAAHAREQEERLIAARETIAANLKGSLRDPAPIADSAAEAERGFARLISARIDADLARVEADKTEANRVIDAAEALARLKAACPNEQAELASERT